MLRSVKWTLYLILLEFIEDDIAEKIVKKAVERIEEKNRNCLVLMS